MFVKTVQVKMEIVNDNEVLIENQLGLEEDSQTDPLMLIQDEETNDSNHSMMDDRNRFNTLGEKLNEPSAVYRPVPKDQLVTPATKVNSKNHSKKRKNIELSSTEEDEKFTVRQKKTKKVIREPSSDEEVNHQKPKAKTTKKKRPLTETKSSDEDFTTILQPKKQKIPTKTDIRRQDMSEHIGNSRKRSLLQLILTLWGNIFLLTLPKLVRAMERTKVPKAITKEWENSTHEMILLGQELKRQNFSPSFVPQSVDGFLKTYCEQGYFTTSIYQEISKVAWKRLFNACKLVMQEDSLQTPNTKTTFTSSTTAVIKESGVVAPDYDVSTVNFEEYLEDLQPRSFNWRHAVNLIQYLDKNERRLISLHMGGETKFSRYQSRNISCPEVGKAFKGPVVEGGYIPELHDCEYNDGYSTDSNGGKNSKNDELIDAQPAEINIFVDRPINTKDHDRMDSLNTTTFVINLLFQFSLHVLNDKENINDASSNDNERPGTPDELIEMAKGATMDLLPLKSKSRYDQTYQEYKKWQGIKKASSNSERVMLSYFSELREKVCPGTLWSKYSMLKSTLKIYEDVDIGAYASLIAFIKNQWKGYEPKKAKVLTEMELRRFIDEAPDVAWLDVKANYSGHSFRRSSTSLYANTGASIEAVKRHTGHSSSKVCEGYIENSIENKRKRSNEISLAMNYVVPLGSRSTNVAAEGSTRLGGWCSVADESGITPAGSVPIPINSPAVNRRYSTDLHSASTANSSSASTSVGSSIRSGNRRDSGDSRSALREPTSSSGSSASYGNSGATESSESTDVVQSQETLHSYYGDNEISTQNIMAKTDKRMMKRFRETGLYEEKTGCNRYAMTQAEKDKALKRQREYEKKK
ncbi:hypothetical protein Bhyg_04219 [Pseudolycoriella hygida]|uniref:Tyr recombinase domain-containing protein n=1 Tax=Pseudolycoriella hygida TaxID=35572 RepID=A0A9Q0NFN2_9DIPT|nr:hypothetical protein Bhyg_04219 [Pseudolycoriella hygida]